SNCGECCRQSGGDDGTLFQKITAIDRIQHKHRKEILRCRGKKTPRKTVSKSTSRRQLRDQMPRLESVFVTALTIWTRRGCDCSNPWTEEFRPSSESFNNCGFCSARVASCAEISAKPAMLSACSPCVLDKEATSDF